MYMLDLNINHNKIFFIEEKVYLGGVISTVIRKTKIFNRLGNVCIMVANFIALNFKGRMLIMCLVCQELS